MKFLDKLRSKSKANLKDRRMAAKAADYPSFSDTNLSPFSPPRKDFTAAISAPFIEKIFGYLCPHATDKSYANAELASPEDGCSLCDMRNLAHCMQVSKRWYRLASNVLYHSIRIDIVHYCPLEDILNKGKDLDWPSEDKSEARLRQLIKTLKVHNPSLGEKVRFFKLPYMLRQHNIKDLAQAVGAMPNLLHVDLPTGFFSNEPKTEILRAELQARCPNIKKMSFLGGAELSLQQLAHGNFWQRLEVLELENLLLDPIVIRQALGALPHIKALKILGFDNLDDSLFTDGPRIPPFPALVELILEDVPNITATGVLDFLQNSVTRQTLNTLSFSNTGVYPSHLFEILMDAPKLAKLSIIQTVNNTFGSQTSPANAQLPPNSLAVAHNIPSLSSSSLEVLNFEILANEDQARFGSMVTTSYYDYLTTSLLSGSLPNLHTLFVRDVNFADSLITFSPPSLPFAAGNHRLSSNNPFSPVNLNARQASTRPFNKELQIYTKGVGDSAWGMSEIEDSLPHFLPNGRPASGLSLNLSNSTRPMSSYGLTNGTDGGLSSPSWTSGFSGAMNGVRHSVIVSNGAGQFLGVPGGRAGSIADGTGDGRGHFPRPGSAMSGRSHTSTVASGGATSEWPTFVPDEKRSSRYDIWR